MPATTPNRHTDDEPTRFEFTLLWQTHDDRSILTDYDREAVVHDALKAEAARNHVKLPSVALKPTGLRSTSQPPPAFRLHHHGTPEARVGTRTIARLSLFKLPTIDAMVAVFC